MTEGSGRLFFFFAVVLYGVSTVYSVFLWRRGFRRDNRINYLILAGAFALHTTAMFQRGFSLNHCPVNNLYEATLFMAWTITAAYLLIGLWPPLRFFGVFASPILFAMGVFALMPALDPPHGPQPEFSGAAASLHAALILLAYGAFGLASVSSIMFLSQEHNLKFHKLRAVLSLLPPIQRLETVTLRLVMAGFALLTLGLAIGGHLPRPQGVPLYADAKVVWSGVLWALYLALLLAHWKFVLTGRRFTLATALIFIFVLLTFWGTNLLSPLHHP